VGITSWSNPLLHAGPSNLARLKVSTPVIP
jgi:hypothetical protein